MFCRSLLKEIRMIRLSKALLIAAGSLSMTGVALAQDAPPDGESTPEATPAPAPAAASAAAATPFTLAKGKILIAGSTVNFNLSADAVGEPISLAPSVWYGVQDKLTVGLTHDFGTTPWTPRPAFRTFTATIVIPPNPPVTVTGSAGAGICLTGEDSGCPHFYDNLGVDALYSLKTEKLTLAAHPGLDIISLDEFTLGLRIGALGRYLVNDKISVTFDPRLGFGLTDRDFNKEFIDVPVWAWYAVDQKISAYLHTGFNATFDGFGDSLGIPLQIGANYKVNDKLTAGLDFGFTRINDTADARVLGLRAVYAL
jgi:outer membrane protein W